MPNLLEMSVVTEMQKAQHKSRMKEDAGLRRMFRILKHKSQLKRGWLIDYDCFKRIATQPCHYCGKPPSQKAYAQTRSSWREKFRQNLDRFVLYNGLDRVDNDIDYIESNLVAACKNCNFAKRDMTLEEFKGWAKDLYLKLFGDTKPSELK